MFKDARAFFSFSARDLAPLKEFYRSVLGLSVDEQEEGLALTLGGGGKVFIYPKPNHEPATFTVLNFPVANVEQAVDQLTARGVRFERYDLPNLKPTRREFAAAKVVPPSPGSKTQPATSSRCSRATDGWRRGTDRCRSQSW